MIIKLLKDIIDLPYNRKLIIASVVDSVCITMAYILSYKLRIESFMPHTVIFISWIKMLFTLIVGTIGIFFVCGVYNIMIRQFVHISEKNIIYGVIVSSCMLILFSYVYGIEMPRSIPVIYAVLLYLGIVGVRYCFKWLARKYIRCNDVDTVIIYGAGNAGRELLAALRTNKTYIVAGFVDDCKNLWNMVIQGVRVYNPKSLKMLIQQYNVQKILLALPSVPRHERKKIIDKLDGYKLGVLSLPSIGELASGSAHFSDLREISLDDLLGRDSVQPVVELLDRNIKDQTAMVTGAGGSIGSELCRQIVRRKAARLVLFDISEAALYLIAQELRKTGSDTQLVPIIGNVQHYNELMETLQIFKVNTIYHAAAYKHVPMVEYNVIEGVRNNIFGTLNCVRAAIASHVSHFILISTDKAVRPANIMGATKRVAEMIVQSYGKEQLDTALCMVRFGNVLGSSGSVVPLFQKQIALGGPITVTHPDIVRYFMSIPEAVQLVIQAGAMGKNGEVFVLDMGNPVKIIDLAKKMIHLSGLSLKDEKHPDGDIAIKITGLRPGEKLYEELLIEGEFLSTEHPCIFHKSGKEFPLQALQELLENILRACDTGDIPALRALLQIPEISFKSDNTIQDLLWRNSHLTNQRQWRTLSI